jgi:RES domain-containing protein
MEVEDVATMLAWIRVNVPTEVKIEYVELAQLPPDWRNIPAPAVLATMGDNWFRSGSTAILAVPSVVIPLEFNYLINPSHPDFARLTVEFPQPFELDPRLWKSS